MWISNHILLRNEAIKQVSHMPLTQIEEIATVRLGVYSTIPKNPTFGETSRLRVRMAYIWLNMITEQQTAMDEYFDEVAFGLIDYIPIRLIHKRQKRESKIQPGLPKSDYRTSSDEDVLLIAPITAQGKVVQIEPGGVPLSENIPLHSYADKPTTQPKKKFCSGCNCVVQ